MASDSESRATSNGKLHQDAVFPLVQRIKQECERAVGEPQLTCAGLSQASCDYALVKPLTTLLARTRHPALLYALLTVRVHFLERANQDLAFQGVNNTRAALAELLATKLLSLFNPRTELPVVLTARFNSFSGARLSSFSDEERPSADELADLLEDGAKYASSALEVAIESGAKRFIRSPAVQQFINDLYTGKLLYKPSSQHSIVKDSYKSDMVEFFDISSRPLLDHNVLRVPKIRRLIELASVLALVAFFLLVQRSRDINKFEVPEILFIVFTCGFALEEMASIQERGLSTYFKHLWNVFDSVYLVVFFVYLIMRIVGVTSHRPSLSKSAFDILALGAIILFPRLCGTLLQDSVVLLGLRAMLADYITFMFLAMLCSVGFLLAFYTLGEGKVGLGAISWIMVKVFLGNSYVGFDVAPVYFGTVLGPALMLVFAIFSNTLLLTILISILTNTFSSIQFNLVEESLYQKAITTMDMVKGDALFEFGTPANLIALPLLLPASWLLSPRQFHTFNVLLIRLTNLPLLLFIFCLYRTKRFLTRRRIVLRESSDLWDSLPRGFRRTTTERLFERRVSKAGLAVTEMDQEREGRRRSKPLTIKGSGGQQALGMARSASPMGSLSTSGQPAGLLAQVFNGTVPARGVSPAGMQPLEDRYIAMENKLDKIEQMVHQLLTGGLDLPPPSSPPAK